MAPISGADRVPPGAPVLRQVRVRDQSAPVLHFGRDPVCGLTPVEPVRPGVADALQRLREVDLAEKISLTRWRASRKKDLRAGAEPTEFRDHVVGIGEEEAVGDHETPSEVDGRLEKPCPCERPESQVSVPQPAHRAGDADGKVTDDGPLGHGPVRVDEHPPGCACGCDGAVVLRCLGTIRSA